MPGSRSAHMASTRHSDEQKAQALAIYRDHGPAEAARQTGINKGTIGWWAHRAGLKSVGAARTRAATESAQAVAAKKRADWQLDAIDKLLTITARLDGQYEDVLGTKDAVVEYTLKRPPAQAVRHFAGAIETLV